MFEKKLLPFYGLLGINVILFFYFLVTNSYPIFLMLSNIVSVIALWVWVGKQEEGLFTTKKYRIDLLIVVCLFLLAMGMYLYNIDVVTPGIDNDEITYALLSEHMVSVPGLPPFVADAFGHPTPYLYLSGVILHTFGRSIMAIRLVYILFGALSIAAFYVLQRLFFNKTISITGSLLMTFSYPFIIISRLAHEITPMVFFQILSIIFLTLAWKKKNKWYYAAFGLSLGMGFYTYVGYRTFAPLAILIAVYLIFKSASSVKKRIALYVITFAAFFISLAPLASYSIDNMQSIMERTAMLSATTQGFDNSEVTVEIAANFGRLPRLFFMGDPDAGPNGYNDFLKNPANVSTFDFGTFIFLVIGTGFLLKTNRKLLLIIAILAISPLVNDVLVVERIPEAMHPMGMGHPNTLRIAEIIPLIYFIISYGVDRLRLLLKNGSMNFFYITFVFLALIMINNWYLYYEQPMDKEFSLYIDVYNGVYVMDIVNLINKNNIKEVAVSPQIQTDSRFKYFINKEVTVKTYAPKTYADAIQQAKESQVTFYYLPYDKDLTQQIVAHGQVQGLQIQPFALPQIPSYTYGLVMVNTQ